MDYYRELESHAQCVYHTQGNPRMRKVRVNERRGRRRHQNNSNKVVQNLVERNVRTKRKSANKAKPRRGPNNNTPRGP